MNRKIKFRAWLKNEKRMVKVQDLIFNGTGVVGFQESNNDQNTDGKLHLLRDCLKSNEDSITDIKFNSLLGGYRFIMFELMQYTGLKDKNGVEIYAGDVIKDEHKRLFVIEYKFGGFNLVPIEHYNDEFSWNAMGDMQCAGFIRDCCKVIGNIYENPELLEVK